MPFDLALSPHGDLVFSASHDLQEVDGAALINQRIMTRLRMIRGTWPYDATGELGSSLRLTLDQQLTEGIPDIDALIREALDPMANEIEIVNTYIAQTDLSEVTAIVEYHLSTPSEVDNPVITVGIPLGSER